MIVLTEVVGCSGRCWCCGCLTEGVVVVIDDVAMCLLCGVGGGGW